MLYVSISSTGAMRVSSLSVVYSGPFTMHAEVLSRVYISTIGYTENCKFNTSLEGNVSCWNCCDSLIAVDKQTGIEFISIV